MKRKTVNYCYLFSLLIPIILLLGSCSDDNDSQEVFDPNKPTIISKFSPESGGVGTRLIVTGENFGHDVSRIKATLGGKEAKIIGAKGDHLYLFVPPKSYSGILELVMLDENGKELNTVTSTIAFDYQKKVVVSTFIGYVDPTGKYNQQDGPFDDCGGIEQPSWFSWDPKDPNKLYMLQTSHSLRLIDFSKKYVSTVFDNKYGGLTKMRSLAWTLDNNSDMVIATDQGDKLPAVSLVTRASDYKSVNNIALMSSCTSAAVHPTTGHIYFANWSTGQIYKIDKDTHEQTVGFALPNPNLNMHIIIHPTGSFAYILLIDSDKIFNPCCSMSYQKSL